MDQYQVSTDPRSGIARVLTVSVETVRLVERLARAVALPVPEEAVVLHAEGYMEGEAFE